MGDFTARFHRPESGIHTVEGNVAGSKAAFLSQKRERQQEEFEERKRQITMEATVASRNSAIASKFASATQEEVTNAKTIGLVTAQDFAAAVGVQQSDELNDRQQQQQLQANAELERKKQQLEEKKRKKKLKAKKKMMATLSFAHEDEDLFQGDDDGGDEKQQPSSDNNNNNNSNDEGFKTVHSTKKDPTVDTSFLPDRARDEAIEAEKRRLELEWKKRQESMKEEQLEIVYSYWDGSGHRRTVVVKKGDSIAEFLENVRQDLSREFREMQSISSDALIYVKEDLILPQDLTFYDLIVTKARGKSGPLFHFDVHDDVRLGQIDARIEKDESHPGKVVERRWYDRNKHIFPASRWEVYDPNKDYGQYTIHGGEVVGKKK
jgi:protein FAM50